MGNRINTVMQPCFFQLAGRPAAGRGDRADQGLRREDLRQARRGGRRAQLRRDRPRRSRGLGHVTLGDGHQRPPTTRPMPDGRARLRRAGHRPADGRRRRPAAGQRPPGRRHLPDAAPPSTRSGRSPRRSRSGIRAICIDCGKCAMVCPHATIRMKVFPAAAVEGAPADFLHKEFKSRDLPGHRLTIQVAPDDCTGCGVCVDVCPAKSKTDVSHKAINMEPVAEHRDVERRALGLLPVDPAARPEPDPARHRQGQPGPRAAVRVLRRLRRLRRDAVPPARQPAVRRPDDRGQRHRLLVDLRRQPADHAVDGQRRGARPGVEQLAVRGQRRVRPRHAPRARRADRPRPAAAASGSRRRSATTSSRGSSTPRRTPSPRSTASATRVERLRERARDAIDGPHAADARHLLALAGDLVRQGVWIIGGDGWAYDIGFGGLDQVLSSGRNVNILVLDTEVYSNTGGQASKATPRGAVAKFAAAGKGTAKKDLGRDRPRLRQRLRRPDRRWAPTTSRRPRRCSRPMPGRGRRWSSPTAPASPTAST